jgi:hypothetical protein
MTTRALRRATTLLLLALAVPALASGQDFGVKAGANSADIVVKVINPAVIAPAHGSQIGFAGGIFGTRRLTSILGIETDVFFARKGSKSKTGSGAAFVFDYFTVPVLARVKISGSSPVRIHLVGGPELGYRIRASLVSGADKILYNDFIKVYDLGGTAGGCAEFGRFSFDIRYTRGLVNVARNTGDYEIRNRTVTALFGVAFKSS